MALWCVIDILLGLLLVQAPGGAGPGPLAEAAAIPSFLEEPHYFVEKDGDKWRVKKPRLQVLDPVESGSPQAWTIFEDKDRARAEERMNALPRLRLNRRFVKFNPLTRQRTLIEDWTGQADAQEIEADIHDLLNRFAPLPAQALFPSTPLYMAQLGGASAHTAEEWNDHQRFVIYVDPFRATGRLHAASTLVHELFHVECYKRRGFHVNRAAAVLPKSDFILLGAADELAAYKAEADFVRRFLDSISSDAVRRAVSKAMTSPRLRWPMALTVLLGFEGSPDTAARMREARKQIALDLQRPAVRYWDIHHKDALFPAIETSIRNWYSGSLEWKHIAGERSAWLDDGAQVMQQVPAGTAR